MANMAALAYLGPGTVACALDGADAAFVATICGLFVFARSLGSDRTSTRRSARYAIAPLFGALTSLALLGALYVPHLRLDGHDWEVGGPVYRRFSVPGQR